MRFVGLRKTIYKNVSLTLGFIFILLHKLIKYKNIFIFDSVTFETGTECNRKCRCCPNAYYTREKAKASNELFHKIIDELEEIDYDGRISLYLYNEPLLDTRIVYFISEIRRKCSNSYIFLTTNGDFLNLSLYREMVRAGLDKLVVSLYDGEINEDLKYLYNTLEPQEKKKITTRRFYEDAERNKNINSRAGLIPSLAIKHSLRFDCYRPRQQVVINAKGNLLLCCQDYLAQEVMGDCNKERILDIWKNSKFRRIRMHLRLRERSKIKICSACEVTHGFSWGIEEALNNYSKVGMIKLCRRLNRFIGQALMLHGREEGYVA